MNIQVFNLHEDKWTGKSDYIGRPSVLGNPFVIGRDGDRKTIMGKYRTWLWGIVKELQGTAREDARPTAITDALTARAKCCLRRGELADPDLRLAVWLSLQGLLRRAQAGEALNLVCYCKPLDCHGDVIQKCLEWLDGETFNIQHSTPNIEPPAAGEGFLS